MAAFSECPTFRELGTRVDAYIPVTSRGLESKMSTKALKRLQPSGSAPALKATVKVHSFCAIGIIFYRSYAIANQETFVGIFFLYQI